MKNPPKIEDLKHDLKGATEYRENFLVNIRRWNDIKNTNGVYKAKKVPGKSSITPKLARQHLEWRYPALSEPFLDVSKLFTVKPRTFEDEDTAKQNEIVLNYQFTNQINRVEFFDEYVRRNVDEGICIIQTYWERETNTKLVPKKIFEYAQVQTEEEAQQVQKAMQLLNTNYNEFLNLPIEIRESVKGSIRNNELVIAKIIGETEVEEEEIVKNQPCLTIIDPENFFIDPSCGSDYTKAMFFIKSFETSKAELMKDSRYNLEGVDFQSNSLLTHETHKVSGSSNFNFKDDDPRKKIIAYEYWGFYDINGDGKLKPILCSWIDEKIIRLEESPFPGNKLPFVISKYTPIFGSIYGESDIELLEEPQKVVGSLLRASMDLMGKSANSQQGIAKGFLDPINFKLFTEGKDYQFNTNYHPAQSVYQHGFPEMSQSAMLLMQQQKAEAESFTGIKAGYDGQNQFGTFAASVKATVNATSKRESSILRRLIKPVIDIAYNISMMNSEFLSEEETIRISNRSFYKVRKEDLKGNYDIDINITIPEAAEKTASDLAFLLQTLGPNGGPEITKTVLAQIANLKNLPVLEEKILNINTEPSEQDKMLKQLEIKKMELEVAKLESEIAMNNAKAGELSSKAQNLSVKTQLDATGETHRRGIEHAKAQAKGNEDLEITKGILNKDVSDRDVEAAIGMQQLKGLVNE